MLAATHADPYALASGAKRHKLLAAFNELTAWHAERCVEYGRILAAVGWRPGVAADTAELPYLPARLFKLAALRSVAEDQIMRILASSGTSEAGASRASQRLQQVGREQFGRLAATSLIHRGAVARKAAAPHCCGSVAGTISCSVSEMSAKCLR